MINTTTFHTLASLLIAAAVLVNGAHAKEVVAMTLPNVVDAQKQIDSSGQLKTMTDLHHHGDSSAKLQNASDGQQADSRSLRLLHHKKSGQIVQKLGDRVRLWWQLNALHLT